MNTAVIGLIGNMSSQPVQGMKMSQKIDGQGFKKVMDERINTKSTYNENRNGQMMKERSVSHIKNENKEGLTTKKNKTQEVSEESSDNGSVGFDSVEDQIAMQVIPYLMNLLEVLGLSHEQLIGAFESLGIMPEGILNKEDFTALLQELVGGEQNLLTLDQETLKSVQQIWQDIEALGKSLEGDEAVQNILSELVACVPSTKVSKVEINQVDVKPQSRLDTQGDLTQEDIVHSQDTKKVSLESGNPKAGMEMQQEASHETVNFEELIGVGIPFQIGGFEDEITHWTQVEEVKSLASMSQEFSSKMVSDQIIRRIEIAKLVSHNEIQMELTPKELGKMSMKLVEHNGVITAQIKVESDRTKELIMQGIEQLKEGLERQGLAIGSFQVDVESHTSANQMQQQKQKSTKRVQEIISKHLEQLEQEEAMKVSERRDEDTQIDYMA